MILPLVSELLARVGRRPVVEEAFETLRRSGGEVRLAGLTDPAKSFLVPLALADLGRPTIFLVESNQRAEALLEPVRYFYRAVTGKPGRRVAHLPAHDVLPYENRSPHAEISEDRAIALWRFATGEADLLIAPVHAALWRWRDPDFYRQLARTIARDESIPHEELLEFLSSAGYEKQVTCEMPGQYSVRGGIIDVFSPEAPQPVRIELLGDMIESIRAFDPNTQRSTNPVERATLLPLTEFPRRAELLERLRVTSASGGEDDAAPAGFCPGWEFQEILLEERNASLFDLVTDPLIVEDEPSLLESASGKYLVKLAEAFEEADDPMAQPPARYIFNGQEWKSAISRAPRLGLEHLGIAPDNGSTSPERVLHTQPTTRYHGNLAAFMAEVSGRLASGEHVMVSGSTTGELERLADICHEYELPYRMGELEENVTVTRLAEEGSGSSAPAMVLIKAPLSEGVVFTDAKLVIYGVADLFETLPPPQRPRTRPKTASFFSDFSDLKPSDYVVHVDHGIGQFEGLRQVAVEGANGEFMLLRYAGEAK
ncbi:MAG: CarD family transcriptional regulator, partial [Candidatus Acidiferrales bacterium]